MSSMQGSEPNASAVYRDSLNTKVFLPAPVTGSYNSPMDSSDQCSSTDEGRAVREVLAAALDILWRVGMLPTHVQSDPTSVITFGEWRLDTEARHLMDHDGEVIPLTGAEYRLLRVFLDRPRRVLSRDQLLDLTRGRDADSFDRSIDLLVSRLRKQLRDPARAPRYIKTIRNEGYCFYPDPSG